MYVGDIASTQPDTPAVVMAGSGHVTTYGELEARSNQFAHLFRSRGLSAGDHLSIVVDNCPAFFGIALAAHRIGLHYTPISTHLTPSEIGHIIADSDARALVASARLSDIVSAVPTGPRTDLRLAVEGAIDGYEFAPDLLAEQPTSRPGDETAGSPLLYSSGTTGRPKGVEFPLSRAHPREIDSFTGAFTNQFGIDERTVFLIPGPLYHTSPLFYANMVLRVGGRLVVLERFDAETTLRTIEQYRVTHSFFVPTMLLRMLRLPEDVRSRYRLDTHVWSLHGAAPCPPGVKVAMREWWGPILWEGYAGSERNGMTILTPAEAQIHPDSVGLPVGCGVEVVGLGGEPVATGETGLVYFTGGHQFRYHHDEEKTAAAYLRPAVSTLGDIGHVDADGFLYLTDRQANVIISGGVNIYPQEAEAVLALHPNVQDVAVIGVPDEDMGESVHALIQLNDPDAGSAELAANLIEYCRARVARYKAPRTVEFVRTLPRLPNGKLVKHGLRSAHHPAGSPPGGPADDPVTKAKGRR